MTDNLWAGPSSRPFMEAIDAFLVCSGPLPSATKVVDIGCGEGAICRQLAKHGAEVTGIDPGAHMIDVAKGMGGGPQYLLVPGEATGLPPASFDIVFYSKSLHHIPDMTAGIDEALRIVRPNGKIIVLEPQADDPSYPIFKLMDDEKAVYAEARNVLKAATDSGKLRHSKTLFFSEKYRSENVDAVIAESQNIDSSRSISAADRKTMNAYFDAAMESDGLGNYLESWYRCDVFAPAV